MIGIFTLHSNCYPNANPNQQGQYTTTSFIQNADKECAICRIQDKEGIQDKEDRWLDVAGRDVGIDGGQSLAW